MVALCLLCGLSNVAQASQPTAPSVTGPDYSVTYSNGYGALYMYLYEKYGASGTWQYVHESVNGATVGFTNKPSGDYYYVTSEQFVYYDEYWFPYYYWWQSPETRVTVTGAPPNVDSLATQNLYTYETRRGDINGDGQLDLFVRRTSGGTAGNGTIDSVILQNTSSGTFTNVVPSAAQASTASAWPAIAAELSLSDFNLDGFMDIVLKNLGNVISGAVGQIIVAPGQNFGLVPQGLVPMNANFTKFANEVGNWIADPTWYANDALANGYYYYQPVYQQVQYCQYYPYYDVDGTYYDYYYCWYEYVIVDYYLVIDYSIYDLDGRQFAGSFGVGADGWPVPDIAPGSTNARTIDQVLQRVFGVRFGRGQLDTPCSHALAYDADIQIPCNNDVIGQIILAAVATLTDRGSCRPLTPGEMGGATVEGLVILNIGGVRVCNQGFLIFGRWQIMAPNGHVYVGPANKITSWSEDYSAGTTSSFSVLIHELTHVYQVRTRGCHLACMGVRWVLAFGDYDYTPFVPGQSYFAYNMEEQAQMVQDRFLLRRGLPVWNPSQTGDATLPALNSVIPF
jgi:hypothetical protein